MHAIALAQSNPLSHSNTDISSVTFTSKRKSFTMGSGKILIIATSATDLNGLKTGSWCVHRCSPSRFMTQMAHPADTLLAACKRRAQALCARALLYQPQC
jgi:hypothetical protein